MPVILRKYVSTFGVKVFSTNGLIKKCLAFDCKVMAEKKFQVMQHLATAKHKKAVEKTEIGVDLSPAEISCFNPHYIM